MTDTDKATGLPLLGGPANDKRIPIDPKLLPDLRSADNDVAETRQAGQMLGYQLVMMLGTAAVLGPQAAVREKAYRDIVGKVVAMHGISIDAVKDIDLATGVILLK
jgi:hypothetical protein